jgi:hypothetical protein
MATSRPFSYNTGSLIPGTTQSGNIAVGYPTAGFAATGLNWWNGPDEDLGYVIAIDRPLNNQPTPDGKSSSVGFWRSSALTDNSFISLAQSISKTQSFATTNDAKTWVNNSGYWTSYTKAFLLDTYTSSTVAYSMSKLRSNYSGNCIRVRRSSDNTELDIGFVNDYLDTVSLLSFVGAGNGFVVIWYDQSTSIRNLTQTTSAVNQPQIVSSGTLITRNGKAVISASSTQWLSLAAIINGTVARSWWFSYEKNTSGNQAILGQNGANYMFLDYTTSLYVGSADFVTISPVLSTNTFRLMNCVYTTATYKMFSNGTQIGTNTGGTTTGSILFVPYNTFRTTTVFFNEFVYWATDQTTNRSGIENDIKTRNSIY